MRIGFRGCGRRGFNIGGIVYLFKGVLRKVGRKIIVRVLLNGYIFREVKEEFEEVLFIRFKGKYCDVLYK